MSLLLKLLVFFTTIYVKIVFSCGLCRQKTIQYKTHLLRNEKKPSHATLNHLNLLKMQPETEQMLTNNNHDKNYT